MGRRLDEFKTEAADVVTQFVQGVRNTGRDLGDQPTGAECRAKIRKQRAIDRETQRADVDKVVKNVQKGVEAARSVLRRRGN